MIPYKQLSVTDILQDCQDKFNNDKPAFLALLEQHIVLDEIIPIKIRVSKGQQPSDTLILIGNVPVHI